jgi:phosphomannomutase
MKLPQNTFREYDVRGIAGKELTVEIVEILGKSPAQ